MSSRERVCIILHLCACTEVNTRASESKVLSRDCMKPGRREIVYVSALFYVLCRVLVLALAPPFIDQGEAHGYMM